MGVAWIRFVRYLGSDVVVQALHEAGDNSHCGQRGPARSVLLEELPERVTAHAGHLKHKEHVKASHNAGLGWAAAPMRLTFLVESFISGARTTTMLLWKLK